MEAWESKVLKRNYSFLLKSLDPQSVRIALNQAELLTQCEYEKIMAETTPTAANELILEALKRRAPGTLRKLCEILKEEPGHQHIADRLKSGAGTFVVLLKLCSFYCINTNCLRSCACTCMDQ